MNSLLESPLTDEEYGERLEQYSPDNALQDLNNLFPQMETAHVGLKPLLQFYEKHVQFWRDYIRKLHTGDTTESVESSTTLFSSTLKQSAALNSTLVPAAVNYLHMLNLTSFYLVEGDSFSFTNTPLLDLYYATDLRSALREANLLELWKESRREKLISREEQRATEDSFRAAENRLLPSSIRLLRQLNLRALAELETNSSELLAELTILMASRGVDSDIEAAAHIWSNEIHVLNASRAKDEQHNISMTDNLTHFVVLLLQWGRRSAQQERAEGIIVHTLCSYYSHANIQTRDLPLLHFAVELAGERRALSTQREFVAKLLHLTTDPELFTDTSGFPFGSSTSALLESIFNRLMEAKMYSAISTTNDLPVEATSAVMKSDLIRSGGSSTTPKKIFSHYMSYCKKNEQNPSSSIVRDYLQIAQNCTLENFQNHFSLLSLDDRAAVLTRYMRLCLVKGNFADVRRTFENYCRNLQFEYFVRPNMDMIYLLLHTHINIEQNLSKAHDLISSVSHVNLHGTLLAELEPLLSKVSHKRKVTTAQDNETPLLSSALDIYKTNLQSLRNKNLLKELHEEMDEEILRDNDALYNVREIYEYMKQ